MLSTYLVISCFAAALVISNLEKNQILLSKQYGFNKFFFLFFACMILWPFYLMYKLIKESKDGVFFIVALLSSTFCIAQTTSGNLLTITADSIPQTFSAITYSSLKNKLERKKDTIKILILYTDTSTIESSKHPQSTFALSVRELHNNTEGVTDPYMSFGFKYREYWLHDFYLTINKKPLPKSWVVWLSSISTTFLSY